MSHTNWAVGWIWLRELSTPTPGLDLDKASESKIHLVSSACHPQEDGFEQRGEKGHPAAGRGQDPRDRRDVSSRGRAGPWSRGFARSVFRWIRRLCRQNWKYLSHYRSHHHSGEFFFLGNSWGDDGMSFAWTHQALKYGFDLGVG